MCSVKVFGCGLWGLCLQKHCPASRTLPLKACASLVLTIPSDCMAPCVCVLCCLSNERCVTVLHCRTNYTRSLAVMSMVGYILGLGDRHPSNIMLQRRSGKILHIDFGDCFEVAMRREKFPETVPFRLTRMLVNAMEISAIEGNARSIYRRVYLGGPFCR